MTETARRTSVETTVPAGTPWLFFGVTFAITWFFWLLVIALGLPFESAPGLLLLLAGLFGPGVAGIGFTYLVYDERGRADFWARVTDASRIGGRWLLVIVLLAPAVTIVAAVVDILLGGAGATWGEGMRGFAANPLAILPAVFFATLPPLLEELGWRGYALDRLQLNRSALVASLILGVVWSLWHLPLFFVEGSYQHGLGVGTAGFWLFVVGIVPLSVAFSWVYNHTARSILAIILLHGMVNFSGELIAVTERTDALTIFAWIVLAGVLVAVWGPKTLRGSEPVPLPPAERNAEPRNGADER